MLPAAVEPLAESTLQVVQAMGDRDGAAPNREVIVIGRQRPGEHGPTISLLHKSKEIDEFPCLFRAGEYRLSTREPVVDMVDPTLDKHPGLPRHIQLPSPNQP